MKLLRKISRRLKEPSTYATVVGGLALIGINVDDEYIKVATQAGGAIAAVIGVFLPDFGSRDRPTEG